MHLTVSSMTGGALSLMNTSVSDKEDSKKILVRCMGVWVVLDKFSYLYRSWFLVSMSRRLTYISISFHPSDLPKSLE